MINTVVFDLGAVLIDWNPRYLYRKIFNNEDEMEWFLSNVCHLDWNSELDTGLDMEEEARKLAKQFPHFEAEITAYHQRWDEMLGEQIEGTVEILRTIRDSKQYKLLALTNWSHQTFPIALERFEFLSWFEGIVVSGDEKLKKPDPKIFDVMTERHAILPSESVFIDDSEANYEIARQLGFKAIHFTSAGGLKEDLENLGVLRLQG